MSAHKINNSYNVKPQTNSRIPELFSTNVIVSDVYHTSTHGVA